MKIAEVSEQYNISQDTLRDYERVGLLPLVHRSPNGIHDYNEMEIPLEQRDLLAARLQDMQKRMDLLK